MTTRAPAVLTNHPGPATETPVASQDTIAVITGGKNDDVRHSSNEVFPSTSDCSIPSLPEGISHHALFTTAEPAQRLAVCGGTIETSCLVLDKERGTWDGSTLGPLPQKRNHHTAVTLKNIGSYLIGGWSYGNPSTTDFLPAGEQQWISGPQPPVNMYLPCAVVIGDKKFLGISGSNIREYQVDIDNPTSDDGWQEATRWPQLQGGMGDHVGRWDWPGCAKVADKVVIAGGSSGGPHYAALRSTEILDLETRTIRKAGDLTTARRWFHIITITTNGIETTFALGGRAYYFIDSIEEFDLDTLTWKTTSAKLAAKKGYYGAVAFPKSLVCQA